MGDEEYSSYFLVRESDLFWAPICILVLFVIAYNKRQKYKDTPLFRYFMPAFWLRILFAFVYTLISQYYFIFADTNHYYQAVLDMHRAITDDPSYLTDIYTNLKLTDDNRIINYFLYDQLSITHMYMYDLKNFMVPRFALPFSLAFGKSYMAIAFCTSFFAFGGCWRLFKMFYQMYPHLHKKLAIATLFMPSVLFWGVALMKDTICIGALGYFLYAAYNVFIVKRKFWVSLFIMIFFGFLIYYIKPYILICVLPAFTLWLFLRARVLIPDKTLRQIATFLFAGISLVAGFFLVQSFTSSEVASQYSADKLLQTVQYQQNIFSDKTASASRSSFSVGKVDESSPLGAFALFPLGIVNTFFRPFPWDVRTPFMAFSFLEAIIFLLVTYQCFRRVGIKKTFNFLASDPVLVFCFVYAIMFGGLVGITTTNFGALVRYKIPCLAFYAVTFFVIMDKSGKFSPNYIFSRKYF
jgi:hypothetical protein